MTDIGKVQIVRRKAVRVVASVLLAVSVAACGSSAEISDGDVETTTPRPETTATSVAEPTLSTSQSEETEESADGADSGGESTESEASAAETSSESSGSFIELLREDIEGQQDYFDLNSVGGSGESALLQAGCEVVGEITWVCPDEVDLSGRIFQNEPSVCSNESSIAVWCRSVGRRCNGASFTDIYAPNANFSGATFTGASLDSATLYFATLSAADFSKAQMDSISLSGADLIGVNLADSNLVGSYLEYADLSNADVTNASIDSADVEGRSSPTDFTGVEVPYRLSDDDLSDVIGVGAPGEVVLGSGAEAWERALVEAGCTKSLGSVGLRLP